jgi:hypothetical protein
MPVPAKVRALGVSAAGIAPSAAVCKRLWLAHTFVPALGAAAPQSGALPVPVGAIAVLRLHNIRIGATQAKHRGCDCAAGAG